MAAHNSISAYIKDRRIFPLIIIVVALLALDIVYGVHFGIEFVGGTQIPITLEHPVNITTMTTLISALQQRVSTFGLKQVTVEGVGSTNVYLTIPTISQSEVNQTIGIIQSQGRYQGIVNGKEAINGTGILKGSIGQIPASVSNGSVTWTVTFFITQSASSRFSSAIFGQANKPIYMFLDRPTSAIILINSSEIGNATAAISEQKGLADMQQALSLKGDSLPIIVVSNSNSSIIAAQSELKRYRSNYTQLIYSSNIANSLISYASSLNYTLKGESKANMTPQILQLSVNESAVNTWPAVGLLTSPVLNPSITNGSQSQQYEISGAAPTSLNTQQRIAYANLQSKTIASILNGGALPVSIIVGTPSVVQPTLGSKFLYLSAIAFILAIIAVSSFIVIRYRKIFLITPILITTLMELFIIVSIIGLVGTIDLSAVAGMIAVVGTGVDAQIIITDEILEHGGKGTSVKSVLGNAFYVVWTDAALLVIVMLPLFFSTSLVTVVGFSESTIIGAILGVLITRPAYSAIVSRHFSGE